MRLLEVVLVSSLPTRVVPLAQEDAEEREYPLVDKQEYLGLRELPSSPDPKLCVLGSDTCDSQYKAA